MFKLKLATRLTLPKANTRQTNPFIQREYFVRQITTFHKKPSSDECAPQLEFGKVRRIALKLSS